MVRHHRAHHRTAPHSAPFAPTFAAARPPPPAAAPASRPHCNVEYSIVKEPAPPRSAQQEPFFILTYFVRRVKPFFTLFSQAPAAAGVTTRFPPARNMPDPPPQAAPP